MLTTEEIMTEYSSSDARKRQLLNRRYNYIHPFSVDEVHYDENGDEWYIIAVFMGSLDRWLIKQCETNEEKCGHAAPHERYDLFPRFNVHGSLLSLMTLRWA